MSEEKMATKEQIISKGFVVDDGVVFRSMDFIFQQFQSAVVLPDICNAVVQRFLDAHHHFTASV